MDIDRKLAAIENEYGTRPRIPMGHGESLLKHHATGELDDGTPFLWCPEGFILSWLPADRDHKYCPWCKVYFRSK